MLLCSIPRLMGPQGGLARGPVGPCAVGMQVSKPGPFFLTLIPSGTLAVLVLVGGARPIPVWLSVERWWGVRVGIWAGGTDNVSHMSAGGGCMLGSHGLVCWYHLFHKGGVVKRAVERCQQVPGSCSLVLVAGLLRVPALLLHPPSRALGPWGLLAVGRLGRLLGCVV